MKSVRVNFCNFHNMKIQTFYFDAITDSEFIQILIFYQLLKVKIAILIIFWWTKISSFSKIDIQNCPKLFHSCLQKYFVMNIFWYHFSKFYSQWYCTLLFRHRNLVDINCFKPSWNVVEENTFKLLPFLWCQE